MSMSMELEPRASDGACWGVYHGFQDSLTAHNLRAVAAKLSLSSSSALSCFDQSLAPPQHPSARASNLPCSISNLRITTDPDLAEARQLSAQSSWFQQQAQEPPQQSSSPCLSSQAVSPTPPSLIPQPRSKSPSASPGPPSPPMPSNLGVPAVALPQDQHVLNRQLSEGSGLSGHGTSSPALKKLPSRLSKADVAERAMESPGITSAATGKAEGPSWKRLESWQIDFLEQCFNAGETEVDRERREQLAGQLRVKPRQVAVWFQNRRGRWNLENRESEVNQLRAALSALQVKYEALEHCHNAIASRFPPDCHTPRCPSSPSSNCCTPTPPSATLATTPTPPSLSPTPTLNPSLNPTCLSLGPIQQMHSTPSAVLDVNRTPPAPKEAWGAPHSTPPAPLRSMAMRSPPRHHPGLTPLQAPCPVLEAAPPMAQESRLSMMQRSQGPEPHLAPTAPMGQAPGEGLEGKQEVRQKLAATLQLISAILTQSATQAQQQREQSIVHAPAKPAAAPALGQEYRCKQEGKRPLPKGTGASEQCRNKPAKMQRTEASDQPAGTNASSFPRYQHSLHAAAPTGDQSFENSAQSSASSLEPEQSTEERQVAAHSTPQEQGPENPSTDVSVGARDAAPNDGFPGSCTAAKNEDTEMLPPPLIIPGGKPPLCPSTKKPKAGSAPAPSPFTAFADELHIFCLSPSFPWASGPNAAASPSLLSPSGSRMRVRGPTSPMPYVGQSMSKREGNPWQFAEAMSPSVREGGRGGGGPGFLDSQQSESMKVQDCESGGLTDPGPVGEFGLSQTLWE